MDIKTYFCCENRGWTLQQHGAYVVLCAVSAANNGFRNDRGIILELLEVDALDGLDDVLAMFVPHKKRPGYLVEMKPGSAAKKAQSHCYKLPDKSGNERHLVSGYLHIHLSNAEIADIIKAFTAKGLTIEDVKYAMSKVDNWFEDNPSMLAKSRVHKLRIMDWGLEAALKGKKPTNKGILSDAQRRYEAALIRDYDYETK